MTLPAEAPDLPFGAVEIDLHVHTLASACGYMSAEEVVAIARAHGRKVIAVTDHDTTAGAVAVRDYAASTGDDLLVLVGMELSTSDAGHVLVFGEGVESDWGWRRGQSTPRHVPDRWIAIKAHPFRDVVKLAPPGPIVDALPDLPPSIHAVERWNGNDLLVKAPDRRADLDVASLAYIASRGKVAVAASDAHRSISLHAYHTVFPNAVSSVNDVVDQIQAGIVRPSALPDLELLSRRVAWRRRRIVGWYVDRQDWRRNAAAVGYDEADAASTVAYFTAIRGLAQTEASVADVIRDSGLHPETALDYLAIVREESLDPSRVR